MKISVLSSGSKGNSCYIKDGKTEILIDLGTTSLYIERNLKDLNTNPENIDAIFLTHTHIDHTNALKVFMSNYVSDLIASNINSLNLSQRLATITDNYNLQILALIGDETTNVLPKLDRELFLDHCDSLKQSVTLRSALPLADSVAYAYSAYMLTSLELQNVISSDFIDSRQWYFERLQPRFNILRMHLEKLNEAIYRDLEYNSETFQESFYRSIVPGVVSVAEIGRASCRERV